MTDLSDFNDEFGLSVPREKHFLDLVMACLKEPHGFKLQLGSGAKPSPHDGRCLIYLNGTDGLGTMFTTPYYFRVPRDMLQPPIPPHQRPTIEFVESLQKGIDAKAEEARQRMCRHYIQHARNGKSGNS